MIELLISTTAVAVASFTLLLLLIQPGSQSKSPLMLLLACLLYLSIGPIVFNSLSQWIQPYISMLPAFFFLLLPALWFYHQALVCKHRWQWQKAMWPHFIATFLALILGLAINHLPGETFAQMFFSDATPDSSYVDLLSLAFFVAVIVWCVLSCAYVIKLTDRTIRYHQALKDVYSNEKGRRLTWLNGISLLIVFSWVYSLIVLILDDTLKAFGISETGALVLLCIIVWGVAAKGLQQRPGFESVNNTVSAQPPNQSTYQRSALTKQKRSAIAQKLKSAIHNDHVHLNPDLNLAKLSADIGEPSQYISQTLSQELDSTFFEYINSARIEDAKQLITSSHDTVLDIALKTGFNSRSSFYTAFKKVTGMTPSQYKNTASQIPDV